MPRARHRARSSADRAAGNPGLGPRASVPFSFPMRKLRLREATRGARGHTAGKWEGKGPSSALCWESPTPQ